MTARTQARDLLWTFDAVRRLGDAQNRRSEGRELYDYDYVEPGVLWWAIDPTSAERRGTPKDGHPPSRLANDSWDAVNRGRPHRDRAVVLIDEIDKADPDIPNNLLVVLGSYQFQVEETGTHVTRSAPSQPELSAREHPMVPLLAIITTNEERELPLAFTRRCIVYSLEPPSADRLVEIAERHFQSVGQPSSPQERELFVRIAERVVQLREQAESRVTPGPSTAKFLDAVRACRQLKIMPGAAGGKAWELFPLVSDFVFGFSLNSRAGRVPLIGCQDDRESSLRVLSIT